MTNHLICSLHIKKYSPSYNEHIPFDDFFIKFKEDHIESGFKLNKHITEHATIKINYQHIINQDIKFLVTVHNHKSKSLIGITNFSIPKRKFSNIKNGNIITYKKECFLIMTDITKKNFFGNNYKTNSISFTIEAECKWIIKRKNRNEMLSPIIHGNNKSMWLKLEDYLKEEFNMIKTPPPSCNKNHKSYFDIECSSNNNNNTSNASGNNNSCSLGYNSNSNRKKCKKIKNSFSWKSNTINYNAHSYYSYKGKCNKKEKSKQSKYPVLYKINKKHLKHNISNSPSKKRDSHISRSGNNITDRNEIHVNLSEDNVMKNNMKVINCDLYDCNQSPINAIIVKQIQNKDDVIHNIENEINNIPFQINSLYDNNNNDIIKSLQNIIYKQIQNIIIYQHLYKNKISKYINENKHFQYTLHSILSQYKTTINENNILFQKLHSSQINSFIIQSQNIKHNIYNSLIQTTQNELKLFQHIFTKFYFSYDIMKYQQYQHINNISHNDKLTLLCKCARNVINVYGTCSNLISNIPSHIKSKVKALLIKNNITELGSNNKFISSKIKAITEEDENEEDDHDDINGYTCNLKENDEEIIEKGIMKINDKYKKILFKKIKDNLYLYGNKHLRLRHNKGNITIQDNNMKEIQLEDYIKNKPLSNFNTNLNKY